MRLGDIRIEDLFVPMFGMLLVLGVIACVLFFVIKKRDEHKPTVRKRGKIIEKPQQTSSMVYWVTVEFEGGQRMKLRVFDKTIILAVGDVGIIEYSGQTIQKFEKR